MTLAVKNSGAVDAGASADGETPSRHPRGPRPAVAFSVGEPAVDLLPPEIRAERKVASTRRILIYSVFAVVLLVVVGAGGATALAVTEQSGVTQAQAETQALVQQQLAFRDTKLAQQRVDLAKAAERVAGATEVDWLANFTRFQSTVPAGVVVTAITADSASPIALYQQSISPLEGPRVASVTMTAEMGSLAPVSGWLTALDKLPGVGDTMTDDASRDSTTGVYTVKVTVHLTADAYDKRLTGKGK
ncbi:MAG: hypothetical protein AAGC66_11510 [Leifsonia sp.]